MLISNYINIINNNKGVSKYMLNKILKSKKAFTIVEVVLVLAIAGVIMAVVFLAVPALQAGQRDQGRKTDANNVLLAMTNYQGNNAGQNPTKDSSGATITASLATYKVPNVKLSSGAANTGTDNNEVKIAKVTANNTFWGNYTSSNVPGQVFVFIGAMCKNNSQANNNNGTLVASTNNNQIAVIVPMDNVSATNLSTGDYWCVQS